MFYPELSSYIVEVLAKANNLDRSRQAVLAPLVENIHQHQHDGQLIFICTHNSRRSHFGQIWAHVASLHYGLRNIRTYSGGTEATAFNPNAIASIERAGISTAKTTDQSNPIIALGFGDELPTINAFSKTYDDEVNPKKNFAAVMTCSEADADCPFVPGATARIPLHYEDPKISDGTDDEERIYDERCFQIASEMFYAFGSATN